MRVVVDLNLCESHALCVAAAPRTFTGFDDDSVLQYEAEPDAGERAAIEQAVSMCPTAAIRIEEEGR